MKHHIEDQIEDHDLLIRIDQKVETLTKDISDIKINHLPHIYKRLDKMEQRMAYYIGGIGAIMVLADLVLRFLT